MFVLANKATRIQMLQSKRKLLATKEQGKQQLNRKNIPISLLMEAFS